MKKFITAILIITLSTALSGQNIQVLNGLSSNKSYVNWATFELYKTLPQGPLYYFTDFKMSRNGYWESYSEISKYWQISNKGFNLTIQYNTGLNRDFLIKPTYLIGLSKEFVIQDDFIVSIDVLYRYQTELITDKEYHHGYQTTLIFSKTFDKLQLSGYCDYWNIHYFIFEPQIWYPLYKNISIGTEIRISNYDILDDYTNYLMAGIKWNL